MSRLEEILSEELQRTLRGPECPAPERWLAFVAGELEEAARERLVMHRRGCPACAAEYEIARAFLEQSEAADERAPIDRIVERLCETSPVAAPSSGRAAGSRALDRWLRRPVLGLVAAALLIALAVAIWPRPPELPAPTAGPVRGAAIVLDEPVGDFEVLPRRFRWQPVKGAARYRVLILAVDDAVLQEATTEEAAWALPELAREMLQQRVTYRWRVEALDAAGQLLAASPAAEFRLMPAGQEAVERARGPAGGESGGDDGRAPVRVP